MTCSMEIKSIRERILVSLMQQVSHLAACIEARYPEAYGAFVTMPSASNTHLLESVSSFLVHCLPTLDA